MSRLTARICDGLESCDVLLDCQAGPGDPCLPDVCDETRDICVECYLDQHCDDGLYCTGDEVCVSDVCTTIPRDCGDGVGCSTDTCNEGTGSCGAARDVPGIEKFISRREPYSQITLGEFQHHSLG